MSRGCGQGLYRRYDPLAGRLLDDLRAGDEHLAGALDHHAEVAEARLHGRQARDRAKHGRDHRNGLLRFGLTGILSLRCGGRGSPCICTGQFVRVRMHPWKRRATLGVVRTTFIGLANSFDQGDLQVNKRIGLIRVAVVAVAVAVLAPALAESQILVICGLYRDSKADRANNFCHGHGGGCVECTFIEMAAVDDGEAVDSQRQNTTVASYTPRLLDSAQGHSQPVGLALHTGLRLAPPNQPTCDEPSLYDRVRMANRERVPPIVKDRSRSGLWKQASAR